MRAFIAASPKNGGLFFQTEGFYCCLAEKRRAFEGFCCCLAEKRRAFISDCWSGICFGSQRFDCCFWLCQWWWWVSLSFHFSDKKLSDLFFPCWCPVGLWWVSRLVSCCLAEKLGGIFQAFVLVLTYVWETKESVLFAFASFRPKSWLICVFIKNAQGAKTTLMTASLQIATSLGFYITASQ